MRSSRSPQAGPSRRQYHHPEHGFGPSDGPPFRRHRHGGGRRRRGRVARGDVRTAILLLLAEEPMHGYQLMQAITERTGGRWSPSPGAVYPAITQLVDEGLVEVSAESGRKVATLTDTGRETVEAHRSDWPDPFADFAAAEAGPDLRGLVGELADATRAVARSGSDAQVAAAAEILAGARRSMYLLLAGDATTPEPDQD